MIRIFKESTMPAPVISGLDPGLTESSGRNLTRLIISDYLAYYRNKDLARQQEESTRRRALLFLPRVAHNPCLHATILLRLALASPTFTLGFWRTLLIAKHSIDIQGDIEIGPGLKLPHPFGIALGWGLRIGSNVTIMHTVSMGSLHRQPAGVHRMSPTIEDDVTVYTQSVLFGPITIGKGSVIGAGSFIDRDIPPGTVYGGRGALPHRSPEATSGESVSRH